MVEGEAKPLNLVISRLHHHHNYRAGKIDGELARAALQNIHAASLHPRTSRHHLQQEKKESEKKRGQLSCFSSFGKGYQYHHVVGQLLLNWQSMGRSS